MTPVSENLIQGELQAPTVRQLIETAIRTAKGDPRVYRKNKRPVGHEQATTDPGILLLSCLLVVTLGGYQADFHRFWLAQQSRDV